MYYITVLANYCILKSSQWYSATRQNQTFITTKAKYHKPPVTHGQQQLWLSTMWIALILQGTIGHSARVHTPHSENKATCSSQIPPTQLQDQRHKNPNEMDSGNTSAREKNAALHVVPNVWPQVEVVVRILPRLLPRELHSEPTNKRTSQVPVHSKKSIIKT
jgi:hypothetical protein